MKNVTKQDLLWLGTYATFYMHGVQPYDIQRAFDSDDELFDQLRDQLAQHPYGDQVGYAKASMTVQNIVSGVSLGTSIIPGYGAIIAAACQLVGVVVNAIIKAQSQKECDEASELPHGTTFYKTEKNHRRAIVGINPPGNVDREPNRCWYHHWGGGKSDVEARWGFMVHYTNDGAWINKIGTGSAVGVGGRVSSGETKGCHQKYYNLIYSPRLPGMPADPDNHSDKDLSPEYLRRQEAVTLYLGWLKNKMSYPTLACMENALKSEPGPPYPYTVCKSATSMCREQESTPFLDPTLGGVLTVESHTPWRRVRASLWYASIRAMFDAVVKMSQALGPGRAQAAWLGSKAPQTAYDAYLGKSNNGVTSKQIEAWPEYPIAKVMSWGQLKDLHRRLAIAMDTLIVRQQRIGGATQSLIIRANAASLWRPPVPSKRPAWLPSTPVLVGVGGAAILAGYLIWRARRE